MRSSFPIYQIKDLLERGFDTEGYNLMRGLMSNNDNPSEYLLFQFNPTKITERKQNRWHHRQYPGRSEVGTVWIGGDPSTISFDLFMDATPGSNSTLFRRGPQQGVDFLGLESGASSYETLDHDRGTLDQVETLKSFQYPSSKNFRNDNTVGGLDADPAAGSRPRFVNGNAAPVGQFASPPTVTFVYGPIYMEVYVTSLEFTHELFNKKLTPVRSRAKVELTVVEGFVVETDTDLQTLAATPVSSGVV